MVNEALQKIVNRHKNTDGETYMQVIGFDDIKRVKEIREKFFNLDNIDLKIIEQEIGIFNVGTFGVYINVNPLSKNNIRNNESVKKYVYCFLDLDNAEESHKALVKNFLDENNIKYEYVGQSGSGYHFLIPVDLPKDKQDIIKGFLDYLKVNVCDRVDTSVNDPARIFRAPLSIHNKKKPFELLTLELNNVNDEDIINNNNKINELQHSEKKGELNIKYLTSIAREDFFFSNLLNNQDEWKTVFEMLNEHDKHNDGIGSNKIFNKNLAIFIHRNQNYLDKASLFMRTWNNQYVTLKRFKHFYERISKGLLNKNDNGDNENNVNYYELLKWSKDYNLNIFYDSLYQQITNSFLDDIEFYYLEDEKPEYQYLIYYVKKDYFLHKNLSGLIDLIYYEAKERGIDLIEEFDIDIYDKDDKKLSHGNIIKLIRSTIRNKIDKENRIQKLFNISYKPLEEKIIYDNNKRYFNVYNKSIYWDIFIDEKKYDFPNIEKLIMNLCGEDENSYKWFTHWLGSQVQNPTNKLPTAVIFQGRQGSGKGVFKTFILDNIFGTNVQEINQNHLESSFNEYLLGKQIIVANEVIHNENKTLLPNVLKNLVTDPSITISRKFRKEIVVKNYTHWIFCTNNDNPLRIDQDDRRYSVFYSEKLCGSEKKAVEFVKNLIKNLDYELKEFVSYLRNLDIDDFKIREPIMTNAKKEIIELNKDSVMKFIEFIKNFDNYLEAHLKLFLDDKELGLIKTGDGNEYTTTDAIYLLYLEWCKKYKERGTFNKQNFGRRLSKVGLNTVTKKKYGKSVRVYDISKIEELMQIEEAQ